MISDRTNLAQIYAPSCESYYGHVPKLLISNSWPMRNFSSISVLKKIIGTGPQRPTICKSIKPPYSVKSKNQAFNFTTRIGPSEGVPGTGLLEL